LKIRVDRTVCTGHARCQVIAPRIYATDDVEGKVVLLLENPPAALAEEALRGARSCPERAITATDESTGTVKWPLKQKSSS
jgi:ferredoxin